MFSIPITSGRIQTNLVKELSSFFFESREQADDERPHGWTKCLLQGEEVSCVHLDQSRLSKVLDMAMEGMVDEVDLDRGSCILEEWEQSRCPQG